MKVLIAEDNIVSAHYLKELLSQYSSEIDIVYNGEEAFDSALATNYDIIFMDFQMPKMDGMQSSSKIFTDLKKDNRKTPRIIACTASDDESEKIAWSKVGVEEIMLKPVSTDGINSIFGKVDLQVAQHQNKKALYSTSKLESMSRGSEEFVLKMVDLFVADTPIALKGIEKGIKNNDFERVRALIHRIKPSLKMLCIDSIEKEVIDIEKYCQENKNLEKVPLLFEHVKKTCEEVILAMKP